MHDSALHQDGALVYNTCQTGDVTRFTYYRLMHSLIISMPLAMCGSVCDRQARWLVNIIIVLAALSGCAAAAANPTFIVYAAAAAAAAACM